MPRYYPRLNLPHVHRVSMSPWKDWGIVDLKTQEWGWQQLAEM